MNKQSFILVSLMLLVGCSSIKEHNTYKRNKELEFRKSVISNCRNWEYTNLTDTLQLRILQYIPGNRSGSSRPSMIIGISKADTIRVLSDTILKESLKRGDEIIIYPLKLNQTLTANSQPDNPKCTQEIPRYYPIILTKNKNEDIYYCKVKTTLWANVIQ